MVRRTSLAVLSAGILAFGAAVARAGDWPQLLGPHRDGHAAADERIAEVLGAIEPLRVAHRLAPGRTWLYSGLFDDVVPPEHSQRLAEAHATRPAGRHAGGMLTPPVFARRSAAATARCAHPWSTANGS